MNFLSKRSFRISKLAAACALVGVAGLGSQQTLAQTAPPGALFDLFGTVGAVTLPTYQQYSFSFAAAVANTTVSFAFREVPAYFAFDDASVVLDGTSTNLLANPGFEAATAGQNVPTLWGRWIQPIDVSAIGLIQAGTGGSCEIGPHSGSLLWCDGSVEGYDAVYQTLATTVGAKYDVSFWLQDNSGGAISPVEINMFGYATDGLPIGTIPVPSIPEPETYALMLAGLGLLGAAARRRKGG